MLPPVATSARKLSSVTALPSSEAASVIPCRRRLVSGSIRVPSASVTRPVTCGAVSEPRALASIRTRPVACAVRLASSGSASDSGAEPDTLTSSPGPAKGMVPDPVSSSPPAPVTRAEVRFSAMAR